MARLTFRSLAGKQGLFCLPVIVLSFLFNLAVALKCLLDCCAAFNSGESRHTSHYHYNCFYHYGIKVREATMTYEIRVTTIPS